MGLATIDREVDPPEDFDVVGAGPKPFDLKEWGAGHRLNPSFHYPGSGNRTPARVSERPVRHASQVVSQIMMSTSPSPSVQRVIEAGAALGLPVEVRDFPQGTRTAEQAAEAVGCALGAIVKSLVFTVDGDPVVAMVPGDRRLDPDKLARLAGGSSAARAPLDLVRESTGYVAGGTPPIGHATELRLFADIGLRRHDPVWAAAGTPSTVFPISLADLERLVQPQWGDLGE